MVCFLSFLKPHITTERSNCGNEYDVGGLENPSCHAKWTNKDGVKTKLHVFNVVFGILFYSRTERGGGAVCLHPHICNTAATPSRKADP